MGKLAATKLSKNEIRWLLTPLPPMRPHSADPNLAKRPEKENCRVLAASFNTAVSVCRGSFFRCYELLVCSLLIIGCSIRRRAYLRW